MSYLRLIVCGLRKGRSSVEKERGWLWQEYQLQVEAGPEHEHVAMQLDLGDGAGGQRLAHSHQPHDLVARVVQGHVQHILPDLQVAAAMDDLGKRDRVSLIPS